MSMNEYPFETYALRISDQYEESFLDKYNEKHDEEYESFLDFFSDNITFDTTTPHGDTAVYAESDVEPRMTMLYPTTLDTADYNISELDTRELEGSLIVPLPKQPSLFKQPYRNFEEIISDMKLILSDYLPDDFDYANNIGIYSCVYWG